MGVISYSLRVFSVSEAIGMIFQLFKLHVIEGGGGATSC